MPQAEPAVHVEKDGDTLSIKLMGGGMAVFLLQTLMRAKFYDDGGLDGLLSPPLNSAIRATLEKFGAREAEIAAYYAEWVAHHHASRVQSVISTSSDYRSSSPTEQQTMMRIALYPYASPFPAPA